MRKILDLIILIVIMLVVTSCAAAPPNGDHHEPNDNPEGSSEIEFYHYHNIYLKDEQYSLYLPSDGSNAIRYYYSESSSVSTLESWTVNIEYTAQYLTNSNVILDDAFYSLLSDLSSMVQIDFPNAKLVPNGFKEEIEFVLLNPDKEHINYVLLEYYYPIQLINRENGLKINAYLPIYKDILIKKEALIQNIQKDNYITLEEFYSIDNLFPKGN